MDRMKDMAGDINPAEIQKHLEGVSWPVGKDDLVQVLQRNGAPDKMVDKIQESDLSQFNGIQDVMSSATG